MSSNSKLHHEFFLCKYIKKLKSKLMPSFRLNSVIYAQLPRRRTGETFPLRIWLWININQHFCRGVKRTEEEKYFLFASSYLGPKASEHSLIPKPSVVKKDSPKEKGNAKRYFHIFFLLLSWLLTLSFFSSSQQIIHRRKRGGDRGKGWSEWCLFRTIESLDGSERDLLAFPKLHHVPC